LKEIIFYGDDAFFYDFPEETDFYYANDPIKPLENDYKAIREAIESPIDSKILEKLLDEDSRVVIAFDDVSLPLPAMMDDVRGKAAEVVIEKISTIGVKKKNIQFICAGGLHRKVKPKEFSHILGKKVYKEYKHQILNHDADDTENLIVLGTTEEGFDVEINKTAAEADLIIYLSIAWTQLNGGWKSIVVGLGTYKSIIPHHSPEILKESPFMEPETSGLHRIIWNQGRVIKDKIKVFQIELVLNNSFFSGIYAKLYRPLKGNIQKIPLWRRMTLSFLRKMPQSIKSKVRKGLKAGYKLIGVYAGDIEKAHEQSLKLINMQMNVPIHKQYDVVILGMPNVTPYNVGAAMNPLLLRTLLYGYLYNMHRGQSPLKKDGHIIISNPAYRKFDMKQHPSYYDFYHDVVAKKPDIFKLKDIETAYLENKEYSHKYRNKFAYHGTHALMVYYWGTLGHVNVGKVIVSAPKNKDTVENLGYEFAKNLDEAIMVCRREIGDKCSIAYLCMPPIFISEIRK